MLLSQNQFDSMLFSLTWMPGGFPCCQAVTMLYLLHRSVQYERVCVADMQLCLLTSDFSSYIACCYVYLPMRSAKAVLCGLFYPVSYPPQLLSVSFSL